LVPLGFELWDTCDFDVMRQKRFAEGQQLSELIIKNVVQGATLAFRSELRSAILPISHHWQHDHWIALIVAAMSRIAFVDRCLIEYRQHESNLIGATMPSSETVRTSPAAKIVRSIQRSVDKVRDPQTYYGTNIAHVSGKLPPLLALQDHLRSLDQSRVATALEIVDSEIGRLILRKEALERKQSAWRWFDRRR
jgi:hypothetical protein